MRLADVPTPAGRRPGGLRPTWRRWVRSTWGGAAVARQGVQVDRPGAGARRCGTRRSPAPRSGGRGFAAAGLGGDLLLANEVLDLPRLRRGGGARHRQGHGGGRFGGDDRRCGGWRWPRGPGRRQRGLCRAATRPTVPSRDLACPWAHGARSHGLRGPPHARAPGPEGRRGRAGHGLAAGGRRGGRGDVVGGRDRHVRLQPVGHRDPGRVVLPDGHGVPPMHRRSGTPCSCGPASSR